ncbi:non-specific lipid-transfer protein 2-like [Triticum dicoccoides]|uniref:non-specific lipid-transfer protein 2-like n=1 Tax=Triticum dicoccoides TaxID=85692 RepID=UPI00188F8653|nr:non-specific lipid-transfer protein 2-like [Triticum dicoccoides]
MKNLAQLVVALLAFWAVVLMVAPAGAEAATCNPLQLTPCAGAIIGNAAPTAVCCSRMNEQRLCMCQYGRDPNLKQYVDSPNGKKVMAACKVPVPSC